jgi:hypothetical protein
MDAAVAVVESPPGRAPDSQVYKRISTCLSGSGFPL